MASYQLSVLAGLDYTGEASLTLVSREDAYRLAPSAHVEAYKIFAIALGRSPVEDLSPFEEEQFRTLEHEAAKKTAGYLVALPKGTTTSLTMKVNGRIAGDSVELVNIGQPNVMGFTGDVTSYLVRAQLPGDARIYRTQDESGAAFSAAVENLLPAYMQRIREHQQQEDAEKAARHARESQLKREYLAMIKPGASYVGTASVSTSTIRPSLQEDAGRVAPAIRPGRTFCLISATVEKRRPVRVA